jgi:hypothetical protein
VIFLLSTSYSVALIIYYAITDVAITTIAHVCAIILGIFIGVILCRCTSLIVLANRTGSLDDQKTESHYLVEGSPRQV